MSSRPFRTPKPPEGDAPGAAERLPISDADHHVVPRRYLTSDVPGTGGWIKEFSEDFLVEEIPLYEPVGEGEHLYVFVEKAGLSTFELIEIVARHFRAPRKAVGHAGLKDKHAITRQTLSVHLPGRKLDEFSSLEHPQVRVLGATWHLNKLRPGHLAGNRFSIRIRGVEPTKVRHAHRVLETLCQTGAPARLGEQRFGFLLNNHRLGRELIVGDFNAAADCLLGPAPDRPAAQPEARAFYAEGRYADARDAMPLQLRTERIVLDALARGRSAAEAFGSVERRALAYYVSACQSAIFNAMLDRRIEGGTLGALQAGDVAYKHDNGAMFPVDPLTAADEHTSQRLQALELSPTGPMWGASMMRADDEVDVEESEALAAMGLRVEDLERCAARSRELIKGSRRPYRVPVTSPEVEGGVDERGPFIRCAFDLPKGSFATVVLREIIKPPADQVFIDRRSDDSAKRTLDSQPADNEGPAASDN